MWVRKLGMSRAKWAEKLAFKQDVKETLSAVDAELGVGVSESVVSKSTAKKRAPSLSPVLKHLHGGDAGLGLNWEIE